MATSGGTARNTSRKIGLCVQPFLDGGTEGILRRFGGSRKPGGVLLATLHHRGERERTGIKAASPQPPKKGQEAGPRSLASIPGKVLGAARLGCPLTAHGGDQECSAWLHRGGIVANQPESLLPPIKSLRWSLGMEERAVGWIEGWFGGGVPLLFNSFIHHLAEGTETSFSGSSSWI